jgi:uncharacterized membrane protein
MINTIYQLLEKIGYFHPLHPAITHLSVGLVMGGFVFGLGAMLFRRQNLFQTGQHCMVLALIALLPTMALGVMDWQYRFAGAWLFPIQMKLALAFLLLILLVAAVKIGRKTGPVSAKIFVLYGLCVVVVIGLGYYGGELVYGQKAAGINVKESLAKEGVAIFNQNCAACHFTDKAATRVGPGLKDLYRRDRMSVGGWRISDANVRRQLKTPFKDMPPFDTFSDRETEALIEYLKTL